MGFTPLPVLRRVVLLGTTCATFDVKCMYYHFLLDDTVSERFYRIKTPNGMSKFTRLPMGFKWATKIAQAAIRFLCRGIVNVDVQLYIDNIMLSGSLADVHKARNVLLQRAEHYGFTLGEDSGALAVGTHRGIDFDFTRKTIKLNSSFVQKFQHRLHVANDTWSDWRALLSSAIYGATALDIPLGKMFHVLKWMAHHNATPGSTRIAMWNEAKSQWRDVTSEIIANVAIFPPPAVAVVGLITDAATESRLGAAIILLPSGTYKSVSFQIPTYHSINDMEAAALSVALDRFVSHLKDKHIIYWGDNTSVLYTVTAGHSKSYHVNRWVMIIHSQLRILRSWITPLFVRSLDNPADAPSRRATLSGAHKRFLHCAAKYLRMSNGTRTVGGGWILGERAEDLDNPPAGICSL